MTDKEAMKLALEALETLMLERGSIYEQAITALKEALAQPEQEPVAWMWDVNNGGGYTSKGIGFMQTNIPFAKHTSLFTTPPQRTEPLIGCVNHDCDKCKEREWVGLTDEEIEDAIDDGFAFGLDDGNVSNQMVIRYVRVIEAKLRSKN